MRTKFRNSWLRGFSAALLLMLLAACGSPNANANPTLSVEAIYTAAYQTLIAQQATTIALTPPTSTVTPTVGAALPTLLPLPSPGATFSFASPTTGVLTTGGGTACDSSAFVADVTIPDNTSIDPGKTFTKTWTLLNNGTCTWNTSYKLAFQSGDQMGGVTTALTNTVGPGSSVNISVKLTAPTTNGTYKGIWRMTNSASQVFGDTPWVLIKVGAGSSATAVATGTACTTSCTITLNMGVDASNITLDFTHATTTPAYTSSGETLTFTVAAGWTGTITPTKGSGKGWEFSPASLKLSNVQTSQTVTFTAVEIAATSTP